MKPNETTPATPVDTNDDAELTEQPTTAQQPLAIAYADHQALETKLNETETQLNEANARIEDFKNQLLRNQAELENIRKRTEKDIQSAHKYGLERFTLELLPVIDSLERGLSIEVGDNEFAKQLHAGLEMTLKLFMDALQKLSIKTINPLGAPFDPALHQAISTREQAEATANTVVEVLQKGYLLHDRLIRPALVVVAK